MMHLLAGKTAIVTGSGRSIGKAVAKLLSEHGANVVVNDLDPEPAEETLGEIRDGAAPGARGVGRGPGPGRGGIKKIRGRPAEGG
ncbi:MAG: SDR family NAD(P)-dependent oxidoreductase, partial [Acidobacteriia bacterium]|nr:SDR family NAD(P)-dependent oxidoreductase [Terriglobia bacterium]